MRKIFLFFAVLLFTFPAATFGQQAKVMAWNLGGFDPIPQIRVTNHVRAIRNINPDVIVLSEVNPDSVATDIADQLGGYTAVILEQSATQNLAILYKSSKCLVDARLIPGSDDGNNRLRKAVTARVQLGTFDLVIVGVHMKAGRRTNNVNTNTCSCQKQASSSDRKIHQKRDGFRGKGYSGRRRLQYDS